MDVFLENIQEHAIVVSSNQIAENDNIYTVVANATFTDPSPVEGKGYRVFVRNGTATINSVAYTEGTTILRLFHSGAWVSYVNSSANIFEAKLTSGNQTTTTNFTQIAITELKVTPTINKRYKVTAQLHLGCSGSGGVRVGISIPAGASIFITGFGTGQPGTTNSLMSFINASGQLFQNPYVTLNSTNGMCIINGEIEMGATAGDVQLTFNSFTNGQTSTVFQLGTHLHLEEI